MTQSLFTRWRRVLPAIAIALLFTGCITDPNKRKLRHLAKGETYARGGKYREAVIEFRNALEIDSRFAEAHYQLGRTYVVLKNIDSAYRELTEAVTSNLPIPTRNSNSPRFLSAKASLHRPSRWLKRSPDQIRRMPGLTRSWVKSIPLPAISSKQSRNSRTS